MVILKKIQLKNFLSHADTVLEFEEDQKLLIDGRSGSGKSGIVEGLIWCFYGRSRVENNRNLIKNGCSSAFVCVTLEKKVSDEASVIYEIERTVTKAGRHSIAINKADIDNRLVYNEGLPKTKPVTTAGIRGSQEYIENEILHSSYLLFINSIAYPQDNVENFVKQPADKRKDIILEIINASAYDRYYEKTREAIAERQNKSLVNIDKMEFFKREMETSLATASDLPKHLKALQEAKEEAQESRKALEGVEDRINYLEVKNSAIGGLKDQNERFLESMEMFGAHNITAAEKLKEIEKIDLVLLKKQIDKIPLFKKEIAKLEELEGKAYKWSETFGSLLQTAPVRHDYEPMISQLNQQIIQLMKENLEECHELGKVCPILKKKQDARIKEMEKEIANFEEKMAALEEGINDHEKKVNKLGERPVFDKATLDNLSNELFDLLLAESRFEKYSDKEKLREETQKLIEDNNLQISKYKDMIEANKTKMADIEKSIEELPDLQEKRLAIKDHHQSLENDIRIAEREVDLCKEAKNKAEELKSTIEEMEENHKAVVAELENLNLLKEAFGPRGVKAIIVDYVIPRLEDKVNDILGKLSDFTVKLDTQKSGVKGDTVLEGLFITIINELGEEFDYNNYSGGEKLKITVAISEALAEIQQISFRILDELFVGLDEDSTENFAKVMETLNSRFSQMICITHLREIKEMFPEKVTVVKTNGTSKII